MDIISQATIDEVHDLAVRRKRERVLSHIPDADLQAVVRVSNIIEDAIDDFCNGAIDGDWVDDIRYELMHRLGVYR